MRPDIHIYTDRLTLADKLAGEIIDLISQSHKEGREYHIAFSGGSTPRLLFERLAGHTSGPASWEHVRIFWVDERCVPPDHAESNYRMAHNTLLGKIAIPPVHVHRIYGENEPVREAERYAALIRDKVPVRDGLPAFDLILLGMGNDGHTASIFPDRMELLTSDKVCEHTLHPVSGQSRITLGGRVISNAFKIKFLVSGKDKSPVAAVVLSDEKERSIYPAAHILAIHGILEWYIDREAAGM